MIQCLKQSLLLMILLNGLMACSNLSKKVEKPGFKSDRLASGFEYYTDGSEFLVGPQLSSEDFKELKASSDIELLINLRNPGENKKVPFDQWQLAQTLGIEYHQIPLMNRGKINPKSVDRIEALLQSRKGKKALVYCSSGNRAAAWYSLHRSINSAINSEQAIGYGDNMGLKNRKLRGILTAYLSKAGLVDEGLVVQEERALLAPQIIERSPITPMPPMEDRIIEIEDDAIETDDPMML